MDIIGYKNGYLLATASASVFRMNTISFHQLFYHRMCPEFISFGIKNGGSTSDGSARLGLAKQVHAEIIAKHSQLASCISPRVMPDWQTRRRRLEKFTL